MNCACVSGLDKLAAEKRREKQQKLGVAISFSGLDEEEDGVGNEGEGCG